MSAGRNRYWKNFKPAVGKRVLILLSGLFWIAAGAILLSFAWRWLSHEGGTLALVLALAGFAAALVIHHFGFLRVVDKNLDRITAMGGRRCAFAFQSWKSYLIIAVMMGMGMALRHSPLPRKYVAVVYCAIGLALILSSIRYLRIALTSGGRAAGGSATFV